MLLTDEERDKFIVWLEFFALNSTQLVEQLKKLPGTEAVQQKLMAESMAARVMAKVLKTTERETVGGGSDSSPVQ